MIIFKDVYNAQVHQFVLSVIVDIFLIPQIDVSFANKVLKAVQNVLLLHNVFNVSPHTFYSLLQAA